MNEQERAIRRKLRDNFPHYAAKCLKIRTKPGEILPLVFNTAQEYIHSKVEQQKRETGKVRAIICKGRQQGCSTYVGGRFYHQVTHRFGIKAFILTHEKGATENLFEMTQRYHDHCPLPVRPTVDTSNAKELSFIGLDSGYKIGTAGNKAVGRSSTIQLLHGCLSEGTKIFYPFNCDMRNIEDFNVGDYILTHKNNYAHISYISSQQKECLSVKFRTLTSFPLEATKEHRFWTKNGWKELGNLSIGDSIGYPIREFTNNIKYLEIPKAPIRSHGGGRQFKCPDNIDLDYKFGLIVGLYLAEGHIKLQDTQPNLPSLISFAVHRKEVERTVNWLLPFKDYYSSLKITDRKDCLTSTITIYGNRFASMMNILCGRVKAKHFPISWAETNKEFCRGILHGYLSGDGGSYEEERRISAPSIKSSITLGIRDVAASLDYGWGAIAFRKGAIRHGRNEKDQYTFRLCGDGAIRLANEIGKLSPIAKRKKTESIKEYAAKTTEISNGYAWLRIRSIENVGIKNVYDFEIDHDDHSYCTIHGATHNSEVSYWPNAAEHAKGILQSVPNDAGTEIFLESTAEGLGNYFHEQWQNAESGESDFIPIFIPWFWQIEYKRTAPHDFHPEDSELELMRLYNLTPEQLTWRRYKIIELSTGGIDGSTAFYSQYPNTSTEAFVTSGEDHFISPNIVMAARKCTVEPYGALIVGCDPARFGDDRTSIIRRRGRVAYGLLSLKKKDTMEVAGILHRIIIDESPTKVCIDIGGLGAGVYDRLCELGHRDICVAVNAGSTPLDQKLYFNKRAEMWGLMREWLLDMPTQIPDSDELHADLCAPTYKFDSKTRLVIEKKEDMKKRGIRSPDCAESLLQTFALPAKSLIESRKLESDKAAKSVMSTFNKVDKLKKDAYK